MEDPARTDYSMLMSTAFLLIVGGGPMVLRQAIQQAAAGNVG